MKENWVTFAVPAMFAFPMSLGIDVIDSYKYFGAMTYAGKLEHSTEIKTCAVWPGQIPDLKEKYLHIGE